MPADPPRCIDCLFPQKPYELDGDGRCAACDRLVRRADRPPPRPPFATEHRPGTLGKRIVLEGRQENGYGLWHPDDAPGHAPIEADAPRYMRAARSPRVYRAAVAG
jgi:hypothetical protein